VTSLRQALRPSNLWLHSGAPVQTWLRAELGKTVKLDGLRDVLWDEVLEEVQVASKELMVRACSA
jgi:hypothetical protein